jgi:uncharacterized protein (TIGR02391 family)
MELSMVDFSSRTLEEIGKLIPERWTYTHDITRFFTGMGYSIPSLPNGTYSKKIYAYDILTNIQSTQGPEEVIRVLLKHCDPKEYSSAADHQLMLGKVNTQLQPYGFSISTENVLLDNQGQQIVLHSTKDDISKSVKLFDSREYHPEVIKHARSLFATDDYFHAVFECCKAFDRCVSERSKIAKTGFELMSSALSIPKGPLRLNSQQSDTEKSFQDGVMHLSMGLMKAIRNPNGHETFLERPMDLQDALDILSLISFLYRQIDNAFYLPTP